MAAVASVALPSTSRRPSTLPLSSTTALRTTVPWAAPERASTGYFGGTLWASRFSAPLEERIIALFSPGSWASDEVAAAASFLMSVGFVGSRLLATGTVAVAASEADEPVGEKVAGAIAEPVAELVAESGAFDCV